MNDYTIKPLDPTTWPAFARLAERHNGVWNGCWCTWFHPACAERGSQPREQPRLQGARKGVAAAALRGALDLISAAGGGVVEAYPQDTQGRKTSASFLYNGTRSLFERAGFQYQRPKGKNHCTMRMTVPPG